MYLAILAALYVGRLARGYFVGSMIGIAAIARAGTTRGIWQSHSCCCAYEMSSLGFVPTMDLHFVPALSYPFCLQHNRCARYMTQDAYLAAKSFR